MKELATKTNVYGEVQIVAVEKSAGEGSKGGNVVGHTKSGKPIYGSHAAYHAVGDGRGSGSRRESGGLATDNFIKDFDKEKYTYDDHRDAHDHHVDAYAELSKEIGRNPKARNETNEHKVRQHMNAASAHRESLFRIDPKRAMATARGENKD